MIEAIDRLFKRLAATYGARWDVSLGQAPIADVKTVWGHELSAFANSLHRIAWALENLPERCPNAIEFRNLCRQAPSPEAPALPLPKANPEIAAKVIDGLKASNTKTGRMDPRAWAKAILANPKGRTPTVIKMAKSAVGDAA